MAHRLYQGGLVAMIMSPSLSGRFKVDVLRVAGKALVANPVVHNSGDVSAIYAADLGASLETAKTRRGDPGHLIGYERTITLRQGAETTGSVKVTTGVFRSLGSAIVGKVATTDSYRSEEAVTIPHQTGFGGTIHKPIEGTLTVGEETGRYAKKPSRFLRLNPFLR